MKSLKIKNKKNRDIFYRVEKKKLISKIVLKNILNNNKININGFYNTKFLKTYSYFKKSRVNVVRRCFITNRSRGVLKKFNLSRFILRDYMQFGLIPGYYKSVW